MKIALAQTKQINGHSESLITGLELCKKAAENKADLILFPEMFSEGCKFDEQTLTGALESDSKYINEFRKKAKENKIAVCITFLEKKKNEFYNSALLIDKDGNDVLHYSKVHTCDFSDEKILKSGAGFFTAELRTENETVNTGIMICFDREFPESARVLMLKGAELILVPNACEMEDNRTSQLKSRAFENSVAIALANYSGRSCKGRSMIISPEAFDEKGNTLNTVILEGDNSEKIFCAEIDFDKVREYRRREVWGNSFRKISAYKILNEKVVIPDFEKPETQSNR